jgi:hypothetical protein
LREHHLDALLDTPAVALFQLVLQAPESLERAIVSLFGDFGRGVVVIGDQSAEIAEPFRHDVEHRPVGGEWNILDQSCHPE